MKNEIVIQTVKTDRFEMDYFQFGQGEKTLVVIPGVSVCSVMLSAQAVAAAFHIFWEDYTCYVFDRTKNMHAGYTTEQMAEDTAQAMAALGMCRVYLFGASHGGMMAQCLAVRHPELVKKMVLCSTISRQNPVSKATFDTWCRLAQAGDPVMLNRDINARVYSPAFRQANRAAFQAGESAGTPEEIARFAILANACRTHDAYDDLPRIQCPVLAVGAEEDHVLDFTGTREIAQRLGCDSYRYPGYSHAVYDEAPDYCRRMKAFFEG